MLENSPDSSPRYQSAGNEGPFTLDGTRTYWVGSRQVALIDPGPAVDEHVTRLVRAVAGARSVSVLVTHGHPDHAPAAAPLAAALRAEGIETTVSGPQGVDVVEASLTDGDVVPTDEGDLIAVATPGHAHRHLAFHWPARSALFAGDLLLGRGDTVWVGEYEGAVADYLLSLERVRTLDVRIIYPAHGPPLEDPTDALDRFAAHRRERIRQVEALLAEHPGAEAEDLLDGVYGTRLPASARRAALLSMEALKAHVESRST